MAEIDAGHFNGAPLNELAPIGIFDYKNALTSQYRIVYKQINGDTYVYLVAGQKQDLQTLLIKRLFSR
jgi:hypothetical protein